MTKSLDNNDFLKGFGRFFLFADTFENLKCLETGKRQNLLNTESVQKQGNDKIP